jgi:biotin carboxyl carrier protein
VAGVNGVTKLWLTLHGRDTEVEVHEADGKLVVELEGRQVEADFRALPDGEVYSLIVDGRSHEVSIAAGQTLDVMLRGTVFPVEVRHPLGKTLHQVQRQGGRAVIEAVTAPMPGLVVSVSVKPGDRVQPGAPVVVVEAMKMQNQLVSRGEGVVREVRVEPRQSVEAGQVLVVLAPAEEKES